MGLERDENSKIKEGGKGEGGGLCCERKKEGGLGIE